MRGEEGRGDEEEKTEKKVRLLLIPMASSAASELKTGKGW